jgi:hypothetical protein
MDRRNAWGFSLFCDDIRPEVGGKISAMGLYQEQFITQNALPIVVPKFCILVMYYEIVDRIQADAELRVFLPNDAADSPTVRLPINRAEFPEVDPSSIALEEGQEAIRHLRIPVIFTPLHLSLEGRIKVRLSYSDGQVLKLGGLQVRPLAEGEPLPSGPVF